MCKQRILMIGFLITLTLVMAFAGCSKESATTNQTTVEPSATIPPSKLPTLAWNKTFGGNGEDMGTSVQPTSDGGYIIAGVTESLAGLGMNVWLIKTDADGNKIWDKVFGGDGEDIAMSVLQTSDGGYVIGGYTKSFGPDMDFWLIKTDDSGNKIWDKTFDGEGEDIAMSLQATPDSGYIMCGGTMTDTGQPADALVIKTDGDGNELWRQIYGGTDYDHVWSAQPTQDGGYILIGGTDSFGRGDVWLIKTDGEGNKMWDKAYEGGGDDYGFIALPIEDGGYILAAVGSCGAGKTDFWLVKTDADGNKIWDKTFGGVDDDNLAWAQQTSDGGYIIAGSTNSFGAGGKDAWLVKTDANGNKLWDKTCGGSGDDYVTSIGQTPDGGYIVVGYTNSFGIGENDLWLIRLTY